MKIKTTCVLFFSFTLYFLLHITIQTSNMSLEQLSHCQHCGEKSTAIHVEVECSTTLQSSMPRASNSADYEMNGIKTLLGI